MKKQTEFFDFAAEVGLTKHMGGFAATETLLDMCRVREGSYVLDIGCGVGVTPCFIAKKYRCRVVGIDILERMVERSRERGEREGLTDRLEFRVADAQEIPYGDGLFDAVITESVTAFPSDKQKAVNEYARVTKSGGYVGLNESTWIKAPPPEVAAWVSKDLGENAEPLPGETWKKLLETAGLRQITGKEYAIDVKRETRGIVRRYGCAGMLGVCLRMLSLYARNPAYRKFVQDAKKTGLIPKNLNDYFGYGIYVGKKE